MINCHEGKSQMFGCQYNSKNFGKISHMRIFILAIFILPFVACARVVTVGQLPSSLYFDTEVSTNIAFHVEGRIRRGQTPSRREIMSFLVRTKCSYFRFR